MIDPYTESILIFVGINAILAYSFYLPMTTNQISGGQGAFMGIGAYISAAMTVNYHLPFFIALAVSGIFAGFIGVLVGFPALRIRGLYLVIMTLGFAEVVRVFFLTSEYFGAAYGFSGIQELTNLPYVYGVLLFLIFFLFRLEGSYIGRAFEAIKEHDLAGETLGINITKFKVISFGLGAMAAGLGGALYAHYALFIDSNNFGFHRSIEMVIFAIFGGINTLWGPIIGAAILTVVPEVLRFIQEWRMMFYGFMIVLLMTFRPQGLITKYTFKGLLGYPKRTEGHEYP
jgi:branched-chain amino acid transport system permease protein